MTIIMYTKRGCHWCDSARELLTAREVAFEEREVTQNAHYFEELRQKSGQTLTPTLDIDGEILANSDVDQIAHFLKAKGYLGF